QAKVISNARSFVGLLECGTQLLSALVESVELQKVQPPVVAATRILRVVSQRAVEERLCLRARQPPQRLPQIELGQTAGGFVVGWKLLQVLFPLGDRSRVVVL